MKLFLDLKSCVFKCLQTNYDVSSSLENPWSVTKLSVFVCKKVNIRDLKSEHYVLFPIDAYMTISLIPARLGSTALFYTPFLLLSLFIIIAAGRLGDIERLGKPGKRNLPNSGTKTCLPTK